MKNKVLKKSISSILAVAVLLSSILTSVVSPMTASAANETQATYYVSPTGSDSNNGTQANPFKTIARAKEVVRTLPKTDGDIVVQIADGFYPLDGTLVFDENDSGNVRSSVRYVAAPGAKPVISGGKMLDKGASVWQETTVNGVTAYKTTLDRDDKLRTIYVNGVRAEMTKKAGIAALSANAIAGYYKVTTDMGDWAWRNTAEIVMDTGMSPIGVNGYAKANMIASATLPANAKNARNIEFETGSTWVKQRICIEKLEQGTNANSSNTVAYFQMPYAAIAQSTGWGTAYGPTRAQTIYNVFEWLSKPGEFYFDQDGDTLYYIPRVGEDMSTAEVVVPKLETVIEVQGSQPKQSYAQFISFEGLTFAHSDWNLSEIDGSRGNATPQGATVSVAYSHGNYHYDMYRAYDVPPAAIHMTTAHDIKFLDGQVINTGSIGVHIENDVFDIQLTGNNISYTGGAGLVVGHPTHIYENDGAEHQVKRWAYPSNSTTIAANLVAKTIPTAGPEREKFTNGTEGIPRDILISNNIFTTNCLMFPSHNTITTFYTRRMQVVHNFVFDSTYGGMSIGWGWCNFDGSPVSETDDNQLPGIPTDTSKENTISYNRVENVCTQLADSGGIYTLGKQGDPGYVNASNMSNNYINVIRDLDIWKANKGGDGNSDWVNGFHPDEGSAWIKFDSNVVENVIRSVFEFNTWKRKHDMQATNIYSNKPNTQNGAPNTTLEVEVVPDSIWSIEAYELILNSGLEDKYKHWIPENVVSKANLEFASHVRVSSDVSELKKGGLFSAEDEVWFVPQGTSIVDAELIADGETMTMASGDAKTIAVPSEEGVYELYIKHQDDSTEKSTYNLYVTETTITPPVVDPEIKMAKAHYGTPVVHEGLLTEAPVLDKIWGKAEAVESNNFITGTASVTGAAIATTKTLWDEDYLYILADVKKLSGALSKTGTSPHLRDSVEIFIEEQNSRVGSYQTSSGQYRIDYQNARTYGSGGSGEADKQAAIKSSTYVKPDGSGYIVETAIPFTTSPDPEAGKIIGFESSINGANGTDRTSVAVWCDKTGSSWNNTSKLGSLLLVKNSLPTAGLDLWLKADKGVETDANGKVTGWENQVLLGSEVDPRVLTSKVPGSEPELMHANPATGPEYDYIQFDTYANRLVNEAFTSGGGSPNLSKYSGTREMTMLAVLLPETTYVGQGGDESTINGDRRSVVNFNDVYWGGAGLSAGSNIVSSRFGHGSGSPSPTTKLSQSPSIDKLTSVMIMKNDETESIYVNGTKGIEATGKGSPLSGIGNTLTIGGSMDTSTNGQSEAFKGRVAEVLIYDRTLTAAEIDSVNAYITEKYLYIPVEGIELQANSVPVDGTLALAGTITPTGATFQNIEWSIKNDGGTGATINNGILSSPKGGSVTLTATIKDGKAMLIDYTKEFIVSIVNKDYVGNVIAPVEVTASRAHTSVALTAVEGYEYAYVLKNGAVPTVFVSSPIITGLTPNTEYDFYQRVAGTDNTKASNVSTKITVKTNTIPALAGTVTFTYGHTGAPKVGDTLTAVVNSNNSGKLGYSWKSGSTELNVNNISYKVTAADLGKVITVKVISAVEPGELIASTSAVLAAGQEPYVGEVKVPQAETIKRNSITLKGLAGYEYAYVLKDASAPTAFTTVLSFTGLDPNTEYDFYQRVAETAYTFASTVAKATIKTAPQVVAPDPLIPLAGLDVWLKADDANIVKDANNRVLEWENLINGKALTPVNAALAAKLMRDEEAEVPYNYIMFDSLDSRLEGNILPTYNDSNEMTVIVVTQPTAAHNDFAGYGDKFSAVYIDEIGDWGGVGITATTDGVHGRFGNGMGPFVSAPNSGPDPIVKSQKVINGLVSIRGVKNKNVLSVNINNKDGEVDNVINSDARREVFMNVGTTLAVGGVLNKEASNRIEANAFKGRVAEVIIYDHDLTAVELESVNTYISAKYFTVTTPPADTTAPTWSENSTLTASNVTSSAITLTWSPAQDNTAVTGYKIYNGLDLVATVAGDVLSYNVTGLTPDTTYKFKVEAGDEAENWSSNGPSKEVTTSKENSTPPIGDTTAPTWVNSTLSESEVSSSGLKLTWTAAQDDKVVTSYRIYKGTDLIATVTGSAISYVVTGLTPDTTYKFKVEAGDEAENWSSNGPSKEVTTSKENSTPPIGDTTAPTWVNSTLSASEVSSSGLKLTWTAAQDDKVVTSYKIYKGTDIIATVTGSAISYDVTGLSSSTTYTFRIQAGDAAGNWSSNGPSTTVTTSSSGGSTPVTPPVTKPETNTTPGKVKVAAPVVDTAKGTATITVDAAALTKAFTESKVVLVEIPKATGADSYVASLPALNLASGDATKFIQVATELGTLTVPSNMLSTSEVNGAAKVDLTIGKADTSNMDAATIAAVGDKPVIELNLKIDGITKLWNNLDAPVKVTIPYTPTASELADPEHITVWSIDGAGKVAPIPSARYDVATGKITFTTTYFSEYAVVKVNKTFSDIQNSWAQKVIEVMASKGVIGGTSETTYSPGSKITRADFLLLLVKALELNAKTDDNFDDVAEGSYYYNAIAIAKKLGITDGVGDNKFDPKANISRQDMMVLAKKAMEIAGKDLNRGSAADIANYKDESQVSGYAQDAVATLVKEGIIGGSDNKLNPKQSTTRAETAAIIYKLYNK